MEEMTLLPQQNIFVSIVTVNVTYKGDNCN